MPADRHRGVEGPAVEGQIGQLVLAIVADRDVEHGRDLDVHVARLPAQHGGGDRIADHEGGVAGRHPDLIAARAGEQDIDVDIGLAHRQGGAEGHGHAVEVGGGHPQHRGEVRQDLGVQAADHIAAHDELFIGAAAALVIIDLVVEEDALQGRHDGVAGTARAEQVEAGAALGGLGLMGPRRQGENKAGCQSARQVSGRDGTNGGSNVWREAHGPSLRGVGLESGRGRPGRPSGELLSPPWGATAIDLGERLMAASGEPAIVVKRLARRLSETSFQGDRPWAPSCSFWPAWRAWLSRPAHPPNRADMS